MRTLCVGWRTLEFHSVQNNLKSPLFLVRIHPPCVLIISIFFVIFPFLQNWPSLPGILVSEFRCRLYRDDETTHQLVTSDDHRPSTQVLHILPDLYLLGGGKREMNKKEITLLTMDEGTVKRVYQNFECSYSYREVRYVFPLCPNYSFLLVRIDI